MEEKAPGAFFKTPRLRCKQSRGCSQSKGGHITRAVFMVRAPLSIAITVLKAEIEGQLQQTLFLSSLVGEIVFSLLYC